MADTSTIIRNSAIGTATAIAAATGIYFASNTEEATPVEQTAPIVEQAKPRISVQDYLPEIPSVTLDIPALPKTSLPAPSIPSTALPSTGTPLASLPKAAAPDVATPDTASPDASSPNSGASGYTASLAKALEQDMLLQALFRDQRSIDYDANRHSNPHVAKWLEIYRLYANVTLMRIPLDKPVRIITEVRQPKTGDGYRILAENLAYYKGRGYDAALLTFYGSESPDELKDLARRIHAAGLAVWFAYAGPERLQHSIFIDPALLRAQIRALATVSDGMLLGWRRTSPHLLLMDPPYMAFIGSCARQANPRIAICGAYYIGNTAEHPHEGKPGIGINCPEWASCAIVYNLGYDLPFNLKPILAHIAKSLPNDIPLIGNVLGSRPYYLSRNPTHKTQAENQLIKESIEKRFSSAGALGTITLHDDGRDGVGGEPINNNLAETPFAELQ